MMNELNITIMRTKKFHFIYHTRLLVGSKKGYFYIGKHSTNNIDDGYYGSGKIITNIVEHYRKEGLNDNEIYKREIIAWAISENEVFELEKIYCSIEIMNNYYCLNLKTGGEGGCVWSEESKEQMRETQKIVQKKSFENNPNRKKHHSNGANKRWSKKSERKNQSKKRKQYLIEHPEKIMSGENHPMYGKNPDDFMTPEAIKQKRRKISEANSGENNPMYGKSCKDFMTEEEISEWCRKIGEAAKGRKPSDETRAKISKANTGKKHSEESKEKNRQAHLGKHPSEETRKKLRESNKGKNKGKRKYNNGEIEIFVFPENVPEGFVRGPLKMSDDTRKKLSELKWIHNDELKKDKRKCGEELIEYLNNGWVIGKKYSIKKSA